jgi:hypothetical protein
MVDELKNALEETLEENKAYFNREQEWQKFESFKDFEQVEKAKKLLEYFKELNLEVPELESGDS